MANERRSFLKRSAALVSGLAASSCAPTKKAPAEGSSAESTPESAILEAVARIVLPATSLGDAGVSRVVEGFRKWLDELEPVAELDHAYIFTDDILYGPPSPEPLWRAQLEALELEAEKDRGSSFVELPREQQESILRRQLPPNPGSELPSPARAPHVAIGLLAYFYQTSEALDLCYERAIERYSCRGVEPGVSEPGARKT